MRKGFLVSLVLGCSLFLNLRAQQTPRQPPQPSVRAQQNLGQKPSNQSDQADDIVRITTNLVQVDAVVTKDGKPVTNLKPEDFEVLQDGKPQAITHFSYISNVPPTASVDLTPSQKDKNRSRVVPPPSVPLIPQPHETRRTIAMVVDDLGVSFESMVVLRDQMRKFLDTQLQPNDLVAIIRTGGYVGALQQFTTDRPLLYSALNRMKWNPCGRTGMGFGSPMVGSYCGAPRAILNASLHSLRFILNGMRDLPGRKSMVIFTDDLPIREKEEGPLTNPYAGLAQDYPGMTPDQIDYNQSISDPGNPVDVLLDSSTNLTGSLDRIVELAIRASVVIYTVDTRGLQTTSPMGSDSPTRGAMTPDSRYDRTGVSTENLSMAEFNDRIRSSRSTELVEGRAGAQLISERTGGFAVFNSNDLGFTRIMNDQQGYYLIGYRPSEETFNRQFHHIKARVKLRGLKLRTRQGFYGVDDQIARPPQPTLLDRINSALISPFATNDITVQLTSFFANDKSGAPLLRSYLYFDPRNLTFVDQPDGSHEAKFDLNTIVFGDNGKPVRRQIQMLRLRLTANGYERALHEGVVYPFDLPIQQTGTLQFRVAILDKNSQKIGSAGQVVEVPNPKSKQLALSGIVARDEATLVSRNSANVSRSAETDDQIIREPAVRRFHQGATLNLAYEIYNAPIDQAAQLPQLITQLRLYRNGQPIYVGTPRPLDVAEQKDLQRIMANARLQLGSEMPPGEYVAQIIVEEQLAKEKRRTVTQWIDFEIVR